MRDMHCLVQMATRNQGLLTTTDLRSAGLTRARLRTLVRNGDLVPMHRGVYLLGACEPTWEHRLRAALLAPGARRVASHRSALRVWDVRSIDDEIEVEVRFPSDSRLDGVIVHRSVDLIERDITTVRGMEVTTPARTLCDAGLIFPASEVGRLVDHAVAIGLVRPDELRAVRRRVGEHGRTGVISLESAVDALPVGAESADSGPEVRLLRLIVEAGLEPPVAQYPVTTRSGRMRYIDLAYPELRLALEYDGFDAHTTPEAFARDRIRQNELVELDWRILRYTWHDLVHTPWLVAGQIRRQVPPSHRRR